ncbi:MAG: DNA primase [Spirochaetota bacterium]
MQTNRDFIEQIKRDVSLESYISKYVKLKRQGNRFTGLCPFHNEKTPSFHVSPEKGFYHCFGCGASGDIFSFVTDYEKVSFNQAKEILSEYSGIPLVTYNANNSQLEQDKQELYSLNRRLADYYHKNLTSSQGKEALDYLYTRGMTENQIQSFQIGFSLPGFSNLSQSVFKSSKDVQNAGKLGIIKYRNQRQGEYYDFFRERIMFPIKDRSGKVVGFGGRKLKDSQEGGKYINSATSIIFEKGKLFYNLNQAANSMRRLHSAILVEGYMDVIGLFAKEIDNVVAPLGTALTETQVRKLKNYVDSITIMLDGDEAGRRAAYKAGLLCIKENLAADVLVLEKGMDPYDLSQKATRVEIDGILRSTTKLSDFMISELLGSATKTSSTESKQEALKNLFQFASGLQLNSDAELYLEAGAKKLGIRSESVLDDFYSNNKQISVIKVKENSRAIVPSDAVKVERTIIAKLILCNDLFEYKDRINQINFFDMESSYLWDVLYTKFLNGESISPGSILSSDIPRATLNVFAGYLMDELAGEPNQIRSIFEDNLRQQELYAINAELKEFDDLEKFAKNPERAKELRKRKAILLREF